jgi:hypothetical protein
MRIFISLTSGSQKGEAIAELHEAADSGPLSDSPMKGCIVKPSKKISWKRGFDEPDRSAICTLSKTHPRTKRLHFGNLTQAGRCDMFPFGLSPQAEPRADWLVARDFSSG